MSEQQGSIEVPNLKSSNRENSPYQSGALLDAALYNLHIAQQYIDDTHYSVEHRLICFHYAVGLIARYGANKESSRRELELAKQYLRSVVSWRGNLVSSNREELEGHRRITCEAYYNFAVVEELQGNYRQAIKHYIEARRIVTQSQRETSLVNAESIQWPNPYGGLLLLARFGEISACFQLQLKSDFNPQESNDLIGAIALLKKEVYSARTWDPSSQESEIDSTSVANYEPDIRLDLILGCLDDFGTRLASRSSGQKGNIGTDGT